MSKWEFTAKRILYDPELLARVRWLRQLADYSNQQVLLQRGVWVIWFDGFDELPALLERVRDC